jgi:hypothetical protein
MKKYSIFIIILVLAAILAGCGTPASPLTTQTPEPSPTPPQHVLTIQSVMLVYGEESTMVPAYLFGSNVMRAVSVTAVDENGADIKLPGDIKQWFDAATVKITEFKTGSAGAQVNAGDVTLGSNSFITAALTAGGKDYTFKLSIGTKLQYTLDSSNQVHIVIDDSFVPAEK